MVRNHVQGTAGPLSLKTAERFTSRAGRRLLSREAAETKGWLPRDRCARPASIQCGPPCCGSREKGILHSDWAGGEGGREAASRARALADTRYRVERGRGNSSRSKWARHRERSWGLSHTPFLGAHLMQRDGRASGPRSVVAPWGTGEVPVLKELRGLSPRLPHGTRCSAIKIKWEPDLRPHPHRRSGRGPPRWVGCPRGLRADGCRRGDGG